MVSSVVQSSPNLNPQENDKLQRIRHTCAHIMAMAVQKLYPGTKAAIRPVTDTGFYYDFDSPVSFIPDDLPKITANNIMLVVMELFFVTSDLKFYKKAFLHGYHYRIN
jgi:threonyl-tRNA synthetase